MAQALYRAHRPKKLSEVVGQEHVTATLSRALEKGVIAHAYLFTGPRGTGKTSIARILAHEINNLPYDDDSVHLDIIEIDAASNRRIDEIRELRDKVHIAPTSAKYKVYIIDEVHMLTKEAFNALLKTLEEPPAHAVFILATTEAHKLPETIISRTQRYAFKPVDQPKVISHLRDIADAEHIAVDDDALELIAAHGEGSFRDSISLLDQVRNSGEKVTLADVQAVLGIAPKELIDGLVTAAAAHDAPQVVQLLGQAHAAGHEPARMAKQLGETLRAGLLEGAATLPSDQLLALLAKLIEVPSSGNPRANLEVALLDTALAGTPSNHQATPVQTRPAEARPPKPMPVAVTPKPTVQIDPRPSVEQVQGASAGMSGLGESAVAEPVSQSFETRTLAEAQKLAPARERSLKSDVPDSSPSGETEESKSEPPTPDNTLDSAAWPQILATLKQHHNTLYGIIKTVRPHFGPGQLTLECGTAFYQKTISSKTNQEKLAAIILQVTGQNLQIKSTIGEALSPDETIQTPPALPPAEEKIHTVAAPKPQPPVPDEVQTISNIFGGAELLES